jgi:hypothetical protein
LNGQKYHEAEKEKIFNPQFKGVIDIRSRKLLETVNYTRGEILKRLLKTPIKEMICGLEFPRNHRFYESFNRKIQQLFESGTINHYMDENKKYFDTKFYEKPLKIHKKYLETSYKKSFEDGPKVLTMKDLEFGFVIWLGSLCLPFIVFIIECFNTLAKYVRDKNVNSNKAGKVSNESKNINETLIRGVNGKIANDKSSKSNTESKMIKKLKQEELKNLTKNGNVENNLSSDKNRSHIQLKALKSRLYENNIKQESKTELFHVEDLN